MQMISMQQLPLPDPGAIHPARLKWLCQPEQIEHTLRLLSYLDGWKKANQQLLYADRQGLQKVQALVLEQASRVGAIQVVAYLDGTARFPGELLLESAAENAARGVLIHLRGLSDPDIWPPFYPDGDRIYQQYIRPFYRRVSGLDYKLVVDAVGQLRFEQMRDYIQKHLQRLVERAKMQRKPIRIPHLARLCIAPGDLLHIQDNRICFLDSYETWEDLEVSDLRKLDPEGFSEVVFRYLSSTAEYIFHLPFANVTNFMPAERIRALASIPGGNNAHTCTRGKPITDEESLARPVREILQDLGVDIDRACPYKLQEKETYLAQASMRDLLWPTRILDNEDWENDPRDESCPQQAIN